MDEQNDVEYKAAHLVEVVIAGLHCYFIALSKEEGSLEPCNEPMFACIVETMEQAFDIAAEYNVPLYNADGYELMQLPDGGIEEC